MPLAFAPSLPLWALMPALVLLVFLQMWAWRRVGDQAAGFVLTALWLRFVLSAFYQITYEPLIGGLSLNAAASFAMCGWGLLVVKPQGWRRVQLAPLYAMLLAIVLSALVNRDFGGAATAIVKWIYFGVLLVCGWQAIERLGGARAAADIMPAFAPPLVLQWMSVALGVSKKADESGGAAYIGGYFHEAAFSVVLLGAMFLAMLQRGWPAWLRHGLVGLCIVDLYLATYRTSLIAAAPLVGAYVVSEWISAARPDQRRAIGALASCFAVLLLAGGVLLLKDRLGDFQIAVQEADVFRPPQEYRILEQELFSSRLYLWSQYLDAWLHAGFKEHIFGFGPEAWRGVFITYAHNTLVSTAYELGLLGLLAVLFLWLAMGFEAARGCASPQRLLLCSAHVSVIILNMATMGQWLVEGLALYALVCCFSLPTMSSNRACIPQRPPALLVWARP